MAFGGGSSGSAALTAHTHNQTLAGDGGQLSETLTDMNGVTLFSLINSSEIETHQFTTAEIWTPIAQTGIMELVVDTSSMTGGLLKVIVDGVTVNTITTPTTLTRIYNPLTSITLQSTLSTTVGLVNSFEFGTPPANTLVSVNYGDSGTKMYLASNKAADNQAIYQYTLSTAYDVSTASYASISFPDPYSNDMRGMSWKSDGSTWVRASDDGAGGGVQKAFVQFNPSTNWDISTSGSVANTFLVNSYQTGVKDCIFGNSGNQVTSLSDNNTVNTYDLSTAYDISTASNTSKDQSLNSIDNAARSHAWNSDGTKCYYLGVQNNKVYTLDCSTPWNITTMTHTAANDIDISGQTTAAYGIDTSGGVTPSSIIVGSTSSPYTVYEYGFQPFAGSVYSTSVQ